MHAAAFLLLLSAAGAAAPPPAAKPAAHRYVRVPISTAGGDVPLRPSDLKVLTETGAAGRVVRLRSPKDDLMLLVVLDLVGDLSNVDPARTALAEQVRNLPKNTWVGVLRAQDGLKVLLDPTPDREKTAAAILSSPTTGRAGLLDSIETAVQVADAVANKAPVRVAILYVTDSDVRNYREDFTNPVINSSDSRDLSRRFPEGLIREKVSKLTDTLASAQTPVFIAHLWYSSERLNEAYQSGLMQLAGATGGAAAFARSQADIPQVIAGMMAAAQSQYSLLVELPPKSSRVVNLSLESPARDLSYRARFVLR